MKPSFLKSGANTTAPVPLAQTIPVVETSLETSQSMIPASVAAMAPTQAQSVALTAMGDAPPEWDDCEELSSQLIHLKDAIPRVTIVSATSKGFAEHGWTAGLWTHRGTGEQKPELRLVFVHAVESRAMRVKYVPGAAEQSPPVCVSLDARTGLGSHEADSVLKVTSATSLSSGYTHVGPFQIDEGTACERCKWAQWSGGRGPSRQKPSCGDEYTIVGVDADWGPVAVTFRSTGIAPLRRFKGFAQHRWLQWKAEAAKANPSLMRAPSQWFGTAIIGAELVQRQGTVPYYVPTFAAVPTPPDAFAFVSDPAVLANLRGLRDQLSTLDGMLAAADDAAAEAEPDTSFDPDSFGGDGGGADAGGEGWR